MGKHEKGLFKQTTKRGKRGNREKYANRKEKNGLETITIIGIGQSSLSLFTL